MPKVFRSDIESSFFKHLSKVWDRLPQEDRDLLSEYWRGLLRANSDEYANYLQTEAATGILTINPYEVRKWRPIRIRQTPELKSLSDEDWKATYPTGKKAPYHAEEGVLRFEHLYRTSQSLVRRFSPSAVNPRAYTFQADLKFPVLNVRDNLLLGYCAGDSDDRRAAGVFLSFGKVAPQTSGAGYTGTSEYFQTIAESTIGDFLVPSSTPIVQGVALEVETSSRVRVVGQNFPALIPDPEAVRVVEISGSLMGNNGIFRVLGFYAVDGLILGTTSLTPELGLSYRVTPAQPGGILSQGFATGNPAVNAIIEPQDPAGVSFTGGQLGIQIAEGNFNAVRVQLDSLAVPSGTPAFHVYRSSSNVPGSYELLTVAGPLTPVIVPGPATVYELRFSDSGLQFYSGDWIKIRPVDPGTTFTVSQVFSPLRAVRSSVGFVREWVLTPSSASMPFAMNFVVTGPGGIYDSIDVRPVVLPSGFDFTAYHSYRLDVSEGLARVFVDGSEVANYALVEDQVRTFGSFGFYALHGALGLRAFAKNVKFTEFNIDKRIAELPALYDRYEIQTLVLEAGVDYDVTTRGVLLLEKLDGVLELDVLIAEYVSYALRRIEGAYGLLVDVFGEDSPAMKNRTVAVWSALLDGPQLDSIKKGVLAHLGMPITTLDGFVTADPVSDSYIEIDGIKFNFPAPVGVGINPETGALYKRGDFIPAFSSVSGGVTVRDYLVQRDWWYSNLRSGEMHELQKYHTFEVEIDDRLLTPDVADEIRNFLDRIRNIGDNYLLVAKTDNLDTLVVESNLNRTGLLREDNDRVFIGDSSDPARVYAPHVYSSLTGNTYGLGGFGGVDISGVNQILFGSSLYPYDAYGSLLTGGFGDKDEAFSDVASLITGTNGTPLLTNVFRDTTLTPMTGFTAQGVVPGDYLAIKGGPAAGVYFVVQVIDHQRLEVHVAYGDFTAWLAAPTTEDYEVYRLLFSNRIPTASVFVGGYPIREGAYLQVQVDDLDESLVLVGIEPTQTNGQPGIVQPEDLAAAFYYSDGSPRVPGLLAEVEYLRADQRDFDFFDVPPRRLVLRSISTKGHNSTIRITETDGSIDLRIAEGTYYGFITYPGQDHISQDTEPSNLPYTEDERAAALTPGNPGDPGMWMDADIHLNDGTAKRKDLAGVVRDGVDQYPIVGTAGMDSESGHAGVLYQAPFANGAQFGTFYSDYVLSSKDYAMVFGNAEIRSNGRLYVPGFLPSGVTVNPAGSPGAFLPPGFLEDLDANFTRLLPGDYIEISGQSYKVREVLSDNVLKLAIEVGQIIGPNQVRIPGVDWQASMQASVGDAVYVSAAAPSNSGIFLIAGFSSISPGVNDVATLVGASLVPENPVGLLVGGGVPLAPGPLTYRIRLYPKVGDLVYLETFQPPYASIDRSLFPVYEGDILRVKAVFPEEVVVERLLLDGTYQTVVFAYASWSPPPPLPTAPFYIQGKIVRSPSPYSLNPAIPQQRAHRVNKGYNLLGDDLRFVEDAMTVEIFMPAVP